MALTKYSLSYPITLIIKDISDCRSDEHMPKEVLDEFRQVFKNIFIFSFDF